MPNKMSEEKVIGVTFLSLIFLMIISLMEKFNYLDLGYLIILIVYFCKFLVIKSRD